MPIEGRKLDNFVTLEKLLEKGLQRDPDASAVVSTAQRWSFRQLDQASSQLCASYIALGLKAGDRVASLMPNRAVLLVHYLACLKGAFVSVPLNYRYTHFEIDHALEKAEVSFILYHSERQEDVAMALGDDNAVRSICYGADGGSGEPSFEALMNSQATEYVAKEYPPEAPAFILFTSGSTGPAKGVTHSRKSIAHCFSGSAAGFELDETSVFLPASSISHLGGLLFSIATLAVGGRVVVARQNDADEIVGSSPLC